VTAMSHGAYREAHPWPYVVSHWVHLVSMFVLGFTGFYIHYPFFTADMRMMRQLHFIFMYVVLVALVWRVWFAFFGKTAIVKGTRDTVRDFHNFTPQEENKHQLIETVKYYLFLRKTHPISGKYNPLQKLAYLAMAALLIVQAYTGFALYGPVQNSSMLNPLFLWSVNSGMVSLMLMRMIHFFVMWIFILITMIHVYLSVAEDVEAVPLMFAYVETPKKA
jgi:Ni/Fe-hydrogenase 1 B-type cytochrome subunit